MDPERMTPPARTQTNISLHNGSFFTIASVPKHFQAPAGNTENEQNKLRPNSNIFNAPILFALFKPRKNKTALFQHQKKNSFFLKKKNWTLTKAVKFFSKSVWQVSPIEVLVKCNSLLYNKTSEEKILKVFFVGLVNALESSRIHCILLD